MRKRQVHMILFLIMFCMALLFLYPLFIVFINSFKSLGNIIASPLSLPKTIHFENYKNAWNIVEIQKVMVNSTIITLISDMGIVIISAMTAYWIERHPTIYAKTLSRLLIISMLLPFASLMIPLVQIIKFLGMNNTLQGAIVTYFGIGLPFAYFMMRGAVLSLPYELEEAALIDGCGQIKIFWNIVLPILQPTMVSIFVMDMFWIWNDFMVPLILLDSGELSTIQLAIKKLFSMYASKWDIALSALVMTITPIVIVFVLLQKKIISGILSGAVKG